MKTKNKRIPLSIIRLYKLGQNFTRKNPPSPISKVYFQSGIIKDFLEYINQHKNDTL